MLGDAAGGLWLFPVSAPGVLPGALFGLETSDGGLLPVSVGGLAALVVDAGKGHVPFLEIRPLSDYLLQQRLGFLEPTVPLITKGQFHAALAVGRVQFQGLPKCFDGLGHPVLFALAQHLPERRIVPIPRNSEPRPRRAPCCSGGWTSW